MDLFNLLIHYYKNLQSRGIEMQIKALDLLKLPTGTPNISVMHS